MPTRKPKRTNWKAKYETAMLGADAAVRELHKTVDRLRKHVDELSAEKAELLRERKALVKPLSDNCHDCGMSLKGSVAERQIALCTPCSDARDRIKQQPLSPSWLRRNWVELTVMATVLGAIGFIVWRAWH